ncbi:MAG: Zn-dependent hydrolase [Proteobacteria bacterium]|nr:Zn-dependent hydrolase [Pseudomonadota bacterium]
MIDKTTKKSPDFSSELEFPFPNLPTPGKTIELAPEIRWLRMPLPFALDHINLWLIKDNNGWAAIDTGISSDKTRDLWDKILLNELDGYPITKMVVTHYHPDHLGNASWLMDKFNIPLFMTLTEYLTAHAQHSGTAGNDQSKQLFASHGLDKNLLNSMTAGGSAYKKIVPNLPNNMVRMINGDLISIGSNQWRVIVGYGHSPEHASLHCESLGIIISGDMLLPKISTNVSVWPIDPLGNPLKAFLSSINEFKKLPEKTLILPSHGIPFIGAHARVKMLYAHHNDRLEETVSACDTPITAYELLPIMFKRKLDSHQIFFAMGEAIAHLNYLWHAKELSRITRNDQQIRFKN